MPYFPVDDGLHSHRKAIKAGAHAIGLWTLCGSWSNDNGTDGFIPDYVAARFDPQYEALAGRLVEVGLWKVEEVGGERGWRFHDWTGEESGEKRNYTRAEVEKKRRDWAARQAKSRERRSGNPESVTPHVTRDNGVTHARLTQDSRMAPHLVPNDPENVTRDMGRESRGSHSVPVPVPVPVSQVQNPVVNLRSSLTKQDHGNGQSKELSDYDREALLRRQWQGTGCPEHKGPSVLNCSVCAAEHKNPGYWTTRDRSDWPGAKVGR